MMIGIVRFLPQGARHLETVEAGKPEVEHHEVGPAPARRFQRADAVAGDDHVEAGEPQVIARDLGDLRLVVDDQDRLHRSPAAPAAGHRLHAREPAGATRRSGRAARGPSRRHTRRAAPEQAADDEEPEGEEERHEEEPEAPGPVPAVIRIRIGYGYGPPEGGATILPLCSMPCATPAW